MLHLRSSIFYLRGLPHDAIGVRPAGDPVQPAVEVVAERARPQHAEAVLLVQGIDLDYNIAHRSKAEIRKAESRKQKCSHVSFGTIDHGGHDCHKFIGLLFHWQSVRLSNPTIFAQ